GGRAGRAEFRPGMPVGRAVEQIGGGVVAGRGIWAVSSGLANPALTEAQLDAEISYEAMQAVGSGLGSAGFIVYDDTACMVDVARTFSRFLWVESCGQCEACKLGCEEITV